MGIREIVGRERASLVLMHPTSLPDPPGRAYGIGELGSEARAFIDLVVECGAVAWQMLPLGHTGYGNSPYQTFSRYAGSPFLVSVEELHRAGDLTDEQHDAWVAAVRDGVPDTAFADFGWLYRHKLGASWRDEGAILRLAFQNHERRPFDAPRNLAAHEFTNRHSARWLDNYAEFMALKERHEGRPWSEWPMPFRDLHEWRAQRNRILDEDRELARTIDFYRYTQFVFFEQWQALRSHARERGCLLVGDIPWYVGYDSSDVWAHREIYELDEVGAPVSVAGVPPDYFSKTGQLWGNPVYDWSRPETFVWWVDTVDFIMDLVDVLRIDHMRAIDTYWKIPYDWAFEKKTAERGCWAKGPGAELLDAIAKRLSENGGLRLNGQLPIIAEDLGGLDPLFPSPDDYPETIPDSQHYPVEEGFAHRMKKGDPELGDALSAETLEYSTRRGLDRLLEKHEIPWMAVLQFGFEGSERHHPETLIAECVGYTGTHDNNTAVGWYREMLEREHAQREEGEGPAETMTHAIRRAHQALAPDGGGHAVDHKPGRLSDREAARCLVEALHGSVSRLVGATLQDLLALGAEARMNQPGDSESSWWTWRVRREQLDRKRLVEWLRPLNESTGRCG